MKVFTTHASLLFLVIAALFTQARAQAGPQITQVEQNPVTASESVCFDGSGFGTNQGTSVANINGASAPVLYWWGAPFQ